MSESERIQAQELARWQHRHCFGTAQRAAGERRTWWVIGLTVVMMVVEIAAGMVYGSMALLADGWHMGTHAAALGITVFAYVYMRRHANDPQFTFGTGKVGALGGFASAVGLAVIALMVLGESAVRLATPVNIDFDEAIGVAVIGLLVNLASAWMLGGGHSHGTANASAGQGHEHAAEHAHSDTAAAEHAHSHEEIEHAHAHSHDGHSHHAHSEHANSHSHDGPAHHEHGQEQEHHDHNLRGAYFHVLADAITSVLAIVALLAGRQLGWVWMDPAMGVVGALVIARWSMGLLRDTGRVLLDAECAPAKREAVRAAIEEGGDAWVTDLHIWRVGPRHLAAIVSVLSERPLEPEAYRARLHAHADLVHVTVEVNRREERGTRNEE
ncbi:MAG: cation diffusion facilitator family transporter [Myxococcota bacterium]|nr:cation diffusion facilitator family transporter [Myxococcota bacterium]